MTVFLISRDMIVIIQFIIYPCNFHYRLIKRAGDLLIASKINHVFFLNNDSVTLVPDNKDIVQQPINLHTRYKNKSRETHALTNQSNGTFPCFRPNIGSTRYSIGIGPYVIHASKNLEMNYRHDSRLNNGFQN
ncbi:hypothetical protein ACJX0J_026570, partial [Zea mays]